MSFDSFGNFRGVSIGVDRHGHTTPPPDACDEYRPFMPVPYPAPWLAIKRRDEGHPVAAGVVLTDGTLVSVDKSGALIPAGLFCGEQPNGAVLKPTAAKIDTNVLTLTVGNGADEGEEYVITDTKQGSYLNGVTITVKTGSDATKIVADFTHADADPIDVSKLTLRSVSGGEYCVMPYSSYDVGTVLNAATGAAVAAAGEFVLLAAPADAFVGDKITLPNGTQLTITQDDIDFAHSCDIIPGGKAKPVGFCVRNVFVYIGGTSLVANVTTGIKYTLLTQRPDLSQVTNYMHEMGTCIQTRFVLRLPWIGKSLTALKDLAATDTVPGYVQTDYSRSFIHFTGDKGNTAGKFFLGCSVVPSSANNGVDAGSFAPFDPAKHDADDICGRVLGVELMYPIRDAANRVRTQFERANEFVGPRMDPNPVTFQMGGSATKGMDYAISIGTNGLFQLALKNSKTIHDEYATYVLVHVNCR